jgi:hypothetical protein
LRHRWLCALWGLLTLAGAALAALSALASMADRGPFAANPDAVGPAEYVLWAVLTAGCWRFAVRRIVLNADGAALVGVLRIRRVRWADVVEVELGHRTGSTQPGGRWRVALRMRDGTARWVPSFVHGAMGHRRGPEDGPGDHGHYGTVFHEAPAHAPKELARLHRELRAAWLRAGGVPLPPPEARAEARAAAREGRRRRSR